MRVQGSTPRKHLDTKSCSAKIVWNNKTNQDLGGTSPMLVQVSGPPLVDLFAFKCRNSGLDTGHLPPSLTPISLDQHNTVTYHSISKHVFRRNKPTSVPDSLRTIRGKYIMVNERSSPTSHLFVAGALGSPCPCHVNIHTLPGWDRSEVRPAERPVLRPGCGNRLGHHTGTGARHQSCRG